MAWSIKIGSVGGIPIRIHLTILLLIGWFVMIGGNTVAEQATELTSLFFLFLSVALHELGHALTAKKLGIRTRDITLYPFGGIALLLDRVSPRQELLITLAGPLVNVIIAGSLLLFLGYPQVVDPEFLKTPLGTLFSVNAVLAIFNALPAFPMDGGRVVRSSLQILGIKSATIIAVRLSQILCVILAALAFLYSHPLLLIIAAFVFYNASRELVMGDVHSNAVQLKAEQVMVPLSDMLTLSPALTIEAAAKIVLRSLQSHFPICMETRVLGLIDRESVLQRACTRADSQYITEVMWRDLPTCLPSTSLTEMMALFEENRLPAILVGSTDACLGIIFQNQLEDLLVVDELLRQNLNQRELERDLGSP